MYLYKYNVGGITSGATKRSMEIDKELRKEQQNSDKTIILPDDSRVRADYLLKAEAVVFSSHFDKKL